METDDGYLLTMHRIPNFNKTVVFLQHGFLSSSADWVIIGRGKAFAYILFELGYDVWLGNSRGNTYSRKHKKFSPNSKSFWKFDWHEMALHDLPAMINFVLQRTQKKQINYFGHSQGTTILLVLTSKIPKFADKFKSAHLLAPVAYMNNCKSTLFPIGASLFGKPSPSVVDLGSMEIMPGNKAMELINKSFCNSRSTTLEMCANLMFLLGGFHDSNLNRSLIPEIFEITPSGSSLRQLLHFLQEYVSGKFRELDYGSAKNVLIYGSESPPDYPIKNIKAPVYFYYSKNDLLSSDLDVERFYKQLDQEYVKDKYLIPDLKFTHMDYMYGLNSKEVLYNRIVSNLKENEN